MPATTGRSDMGRGAAAPGATRRLVRGALALAGAIASGAAAASAQAPRDTATACRSVVSAAQVGTWRAELRLAIRKADSDQPLARPAADYVLDAIRQQLVLPPALDTDTWRSARDSSLGYGMLTSRLYVELARGDGRVRKAGVLVRSGSAALDAALLAAVRAADSTRSIGPLTELTEAGMLPVVIDLTTVSSALPGADAPVSMVVGTMALPVVRGYVRAVPLWIPRVLLAEDAKQVTGSMTVDYVIDRDGRVAPGTTDVRDFSSLDYVGQVLRAMPSWRHEPARIGGCAVRQFAQVRVDAGLRP